MKGADEEYCNSDFPNHFLTGGRNGMVQIDNKIDMGPELQSIPGFHQ